MKLVLNYIGNDSWRRPVYECEGSLYVDVDSRKHRAPNICTKCNNAFDGEPDIPIRERIEVEFIPDRVTL